MRVSEIKRYYDVYSGWKAAYWMKDIEKIRNGELIPPKLIQAHPEAWCSHDCFFCAYRNSCWQHHGMEFFGEWASEEDRIPKQTGKPKGKLIPGVSDWPKEIALSLPKQMEEEGVKACEITGSGEPLLYPYIKEFIDKLVKHNIEIALVTNGQFLTKDILDRLNNVRWIRFSIDAATAKTHAKVHGVSEKVFPIVIKNLEQTIERNFDDCLIGVSYIITKYNIDEIYEAALKYKEMGVDNIRFSFQYEPTGTAGLTNEEKERARKLLLKARELSDSKFKVFGMVERLETFAKPNIDFTFCGYQFFTWSLGYDCKFYPCCIQIYNKGYAFGDLKKQSLHEIIYGEERRKYIENFDVRKCHNCWLRDRNIAIETLIAPEKRLGHVNFV